MRFSRCLMRRYSFRNTHEPAPEIKSHIGKYTKAYANLPERYIARNATKLMQKSYDHPAFVPRLKTWDAQYHGFTRPWTVEYWRETGAFNPDEHPDIVQPIREEDWMWFRGDRVEILKGDDKGKQGYIVYVVQERNWVYVEGLNCKNIVDGKDGAFPGYIRQEEQPLLVTTDIKLVDPSDEAACEVEWRYTEAGERVRVSTRSDRILPFPTQALETVDYKTKAGYKENELKDTPARVVEEITFVPKLATFEMDLMERYGIKEDRVPARTYWY